MLPLYVKGDLRKHYAALPVRDWACKERIAMCQDGIEQVEIPDP